MASTFYSDQYYIAGPGVGAGGDMKVFIGSYQFASITVINDVVHLFTLPVGFTPLGGHLVGDIIDNAIETLEIDIGVVGDAQKYLDSGVITTDAVAEVRATDCIWRPLMEDLATIKPTEITTAVDCIATITAASSTTGTGTLTVVLWGLYRDPRVV